MKTKEAYRDFWWGANAQHFPEEECIIKVSTPKVLFSSFTIVVLA